MQPKILANTDHCFIEVAAVVFRVSPVRSEIQRPQWQIIVSDWKLHASGSYMFQECLELTFHRPLVFIFFQ